MTAFEAMWAPFDTTWVPLGRRLRPCGSLYGIPAGPQGPPRPPSAEKNLHARPVWLLGPPFKTPTHPQLCQRMPQYHNALEILAVHFSPGRASTKSGSRQTGQAPLGDPSKILPRCVRGPCMYRRSWKATLRDEDPQDVSERVRLVSLRRGEAVDL